MSPAGELLHVSGATIFTTGSPVFYGCYPRNNSESPGFGGNQNCVPGLRGTVTNGERAFGLLLLPGHSEDTRLKKTLSLPVKEAYLFTFEP